MQSSDVIHPQNDAFSWRHLSGLSLGLLALVFYTFAVFRMDYVSNRLLNLRPYPDAIEYYSMARSLAKGGPPKIQIGRDWLPSRYPPGYPVLMLPWLKVLPEEEQILAPFRTSQTLGLILLLAVWLFYWRLGNPLAAGVAVALLVTTPGFVIYSRSSMSDISGVALAGIALLAASQGLLTQKRRWIYLCVLFLGFAVTVRTQLVFLGPVLIAMALINPEKNWRRWLLHCLLVLIVFGLAVSPSFFINYQQFGNPFQTGYDFWVNGFAGSGDTFSLRNIPESLSSLWSEFWQTSAKFSVANIFGTGAHFTPALPLLALIGCAFLRDWKLMISLGLPVATSLFLTMIYNYHDGRMFLMIVVMLIPLATLAICRTLELSRGKKLLLAPPVFILAVLALLGFPSQSGYPKKPWRSQFIDLLATVRRKVPNPARENIAAAEFVRCAGKRPGLVLSRIDPLLLNELLPPRFIVAPLDGAHAYLANRFWRYGSAEASALAAQELATGRPVYALFAFAKNLEPELENIPSVENYRWIPLRAPNKKATILQLVPIKM